MTCNDKPTHELESNVYNSGQVRLYGIPYTYVGPTAPADDKPKEVKLNNLRVKFRTTSGFTVGAVDARELGVIHLLAIPPNGKTMTCGIIFGYAFEGHCYELPRPKLMVIPDTPEAIPPGDCGFTDKTNYRVWVVDKLEQCLELEINQGFVEQVVLEANLPGRRSPTAYAGKANISHRSGRLTE